MRIYFLVATFVALNFAPALASELDQQGFNLDGKRLRTTPVLELRASKKQTPLSLSEAQNDYSRFLESEPEDLGSILKKGSNPFENKVETPKRRSTKTHIWVIDSNHALSLFNKNKYRQAEWLFKTAIRKAKGKEDWRTQYYYGESLFKQNKIAEAAVHYEIAFKKPLGATMRELREKLALCYSIMGNHKRASLHFKFLLKKKNSLDLCDKKLLFAYARTLNAYSFYDKASKIFNLAVNKED